MHKRLTLIMKPTVLCNCSCKYCITPTDIPKSRMSLDIIESFCQKLSKSSIYDQFTFIWHGGEPMMMGVSFYEEVFKIQSRYFDQRAVFNTFQSNCTLIDDNWKHFLKSNHIRVSTSLDGDKSVHDANRIKQGKGTFDETLSNIKWLQQEHLLAGVVTVVSKSNVQHIDRILRFFAQNNIHTRLNPILPAERLDNSSEDLGISPVDYAQCLIECYDKWIIGEYNTIDGKPISLAPLNEIIYNLCSGRSPRLCNFAGDCYDKFISINPVGDLYNCGRFCDIDEFKIANVRDDFESIDDIMLKKRQLITWEPANSEECLNCKWFSACRRGCPNSAYLFYKKIQDKDPYCEGYKLLFEHISTSIKQSII